MSATRALESNLLLFIILVPKQETSILKNLLKTILKQKFLSYDLRVLFLKKNPEVVNTWKPKLYKNSSVWTVAEKLGSFLGN